jgi:8-oxo-dGTP diphosphatase
MYDSQKAHYISITGILVKDGKFLITKRSPDEKNFPGLWTVPGGKLVMDDYTKRPKDTSVHWYNVFEDVLMREVKEEIGIGIKNIKYLTSIAFIRDDNIPTIIVSLYGEPDGEKIELSPELTEYEWVSLEEAKNYELIEGIYEELEMLDKYINGEEMGIWEKS